MDSSRSISRFDSEREFEDVENVRRTHQDCVEIEKEVKLEIEVKNLTLKNQPYSEDLSNQPAAG